MHSTYANYCWSKSVTGCLVEVGEFVSCIYETGVGRHVRKQSNAGFVFYVTDTNKLINGNVSILVGYLLKSHVTAVVSLLTRFLR